MYRRDYYLTQLDRFRDKSPIKVITGVRRCGKSTLLDLFEASLLAEGMEAERIVRVNFEDMAFEHIKTHADLAAYVGSARPREGKAYLIFDEIQRVENWEKAVNSLRLVKDNDIYITGSNAGLLSSELATHIAGRYVEIGMFPFSFKEYADARTEAFGSESGSKEALFARYLEEGGFPGLLEYRVDRQAKNTYLEGILNTIILKDVIERGGVRDPLLLEKLVVYLANNNASPFSTKKIADYLTSAGRKTHSATVDSYTHALEKAFAVYRAPRYDVKGKELLKTLGKYYFVDTGVKNLLLARGGFDYGADLETVVYFELLRRGGKIRVGKIGELEVDFVVETADGRAYYQVSASVLDETTLKRELASLRAVPDDYPKYLLTMDRFPKPDFDGIRQINIIDFLLGSDR